MTGSVKLTAMVQDGTGITPAVLLIDGAIKVAGLPVAAMQAVSSQHPHLAAKPIVALRYDFQDRP